MADWIYYRIDLDVQGAITQLPDSQKVLGALIHRFSETYSSAEATQLVQGIRENTVPLTLSNILPRGYLPVPHTELLDQLSRQSMDSKDRKEIYKAVKKRLYVKRAQLEEIMSEPQRAACIYPYVSSKSTQQIHASIDSKRYNLPGLDPDLFSVPGVIIQEVRSEQTKELIREYSLYMAIERGTEGERLLDMLKLEANRAGKFVLGARGSQGLNTFIVKDVLEEMRVESNAAGYYLNLGMLLPGQISFDKSSLKLFTSERRPYNPPGGWDKAHHEGQFISFIEQGSIIYAPEGVGHAGESITSPAFTRDIVFGNALLYPVNKEEAS